ncbi:MAG: hypothetical protein K2X29_05225 [Candidatus Obscuribacterales bacterium]|nr:hypothetical protein [Candidatus Obscuribacterales bacterium]
MLEPIKTKYFSGKPGAVRVLLIAALCLLFATNALSGCSMAHGKGRNLAKNVYLELVDWHIVGLWVINTPCCWIRVANYNDVPIKNITIRYKTYGYEGQLLTTGTYTLEYEVAPGSVKNFIEQYIGLVDLESDMLSVEVESVEQE